jgi:hypothetical protein
MFFFEKNQIYLLWKTILNAITILSEDKKKKNMTERVINIAFRIVFYSIPT